MKSLLNKKLVLITAVYWFLLLYMIAALLFWFIKLNHHANETAKMQLSILNTNDTDFALKAKKIETIKNRKIAQYLGEGTTFLAVILIGAVFVYRATRKQIKLSVQQQNFMMAVTHELKTPIAITHLNLETLQKRKLDEEKQQKLICNTIQEANRLNSLCNNILLAAQLDGGNYYETKMELNFSDLIENCIEEFANRFPQRRLEADIQQQLYISGEVLLLQILANNLIENALKYSNKEIPVTIKLIKEKNKILLSVMDRGCGVKQQDRKKIFNKFYRAGNESTRTTKGTGLGLYLCKKIMKSHNGNITMTNNIPQGSIFTAEFNV
jgi:two-component system sensor histidine kinase CiaH